MTATIYIDESAFEGSVMAELQKVKIPCQSAMANTFYSVVMNNFDLPNGEDRPEPWEKLRYMYAQSVHGGDRTPRLQLTENLKDSIDIGDNSEDCASVFTFNSYATFHQEGGTSYFNGKAYEIPARPFFPIANGEVTQYTADKCVAACEQTLKEALNGTP